MKGAEPKKLIDMRRGIYSNQGYREYKAHLEKIREKTGEPSILEKFFPSIPEEAIRITINTIINGLYMWDASVHRLVVNDDLIDEYGLGDEAINWGDLKCISVSKIDAHGQDIEIYEAIVDEANSTALEKFLEKELLALGWIVRVRTEW